ncbi:MAG: M60 family metallopeptidase [Marinifilaceae bacterium]
MKQSFISALLLSGTFVLSSSSLLACNQCENTSKVVNTTYSLETSKKVKVEKVHTDNFEHDGVLANCIDGNKNTIYHSRWRRDGAKLPVVLDFEFDGNQQIDYIVYYPRVDSENGRIGQFELQYKSKGDKEFKKFDTSFDFQQSGEAQRLILPTPIKKAQSIRFTVKSGVHNLVTCSEMEFHANIKEPKEIDLFTDASCSALKPDVTEKQISKAKHAFYQALAMDISSGVYSKQGRMRTYNAYPSPLDGAKKLKTNAFNLLDNPTGISVNKGDTIVCFANGIGEKRVSLKLMKWLKGFNGEDIALYDGANKFVASDSGLMYVCYFDTDYKTASPITVNFITGNVNNYYDATVNNNADWKQMLANATNPYFDVLGKYSHIVYRTEDFKKFAPNDIERVVQIYDSIVSLEQELLGLYKYNKLVPNRILYQGVDHSFMYATWYRTAYNHGTMRDILPIEGARSNWGLYHEVGHMHQTRPGFLWIGMTEVTNNLYSMHVQRAMGYPSRLLVSNNYQGAYNQIIVPEKIHAANGPFEKLVPIWQIYLYTHEVLGQKDFYLDLHEAVRNDNRSLTHGEIQLNYVKMCCDIAKTDFTDFFEQWGLLRPIDMSVNDYSTAQLSCTQQQVDDVKKQIKAKGYKKPLEIIYLKDDNINLYKQPKAIVKNKIEVANNKLCFNEWENCVAFELYTMDNGVQKRSAISIKPEFELSKLKKGDIIKAVAANGDRTEVSVDSYLPKKIR